MDSRNQFSHIITNLGDFITPDFPKMLHSISEYVCLNRTDLNNDEIKTKLNEYLVVSHPHIEAFKLGQMNESDFDEKLVALFKDKFNLDIDRDKFNTFWSAMQPNFAQFKNNLETVLEYNKNSNHTLIVVSHTNLKDIRHIKKELIDNKHTFDEQLDGSILIDRSITLYVSYMLGKKKIELINHAKSQLQNNPNLDSALGKLNLLAQPTPSPVSILYVHGVNQIDDAFLKKQLAAEHAQAEHEFSNVSVWDKKKIPLKEFLDNPAPAKKLNLSKL